MIIEGVLRLGQFTTANAPAGTEGALYFDTTDNTTKLYSNSAWGDLGGDTALWTQSGNDIFYNNGDVGIGTSTPGALLHVAGTGKFSGSLDMTSQKITNLAVPTTDSDAVTKAYVDAQGDENWFTATWTLLGSGTGSFSIATFVCRTSAYSQTSSVVDTGYTLPTTASEFILCLNSTTNGSCSVIVSMIPPYSATKALSYIGTGAACVNGRIIKMFGSSTEPTAADCTTSITLGDKASYYNDTLDVCTTTPLAKLWVSATSIYVGSDLHVRLQNTNYVDKQGSFMKGHTAWSSPYSYSIWYR